MENAIQAVEDEIARTRPIIKEKSTLFAMDAAFREIALIAGRPDQPEIIFALDTVERTYARLAAVALGRPASTEGIPVGTAFAATFLILRGFMHHSKFPSITLRHEASNA